VALDVAALGEACRGLRIDGGVEVGGVGEEGLELEAVVLGQAEAEGLFDALEGVGLEVVEVVPEALTGEVLGGDGEQTRQDGTWVPLGQLCLRAGAKGRAEGGEREVVSHGMALPPFSGMLWELGVEAEVLGDPPEGSHGAEVADQCSGGAVRL
jgi:hypothetical protein